MSNERDHDVQREYELGDLHDLPVVRATEFHDWAPDWFDDSNDPAAAPDNTASASNVLNSDETRFLRIVQSNPGQPSGIYPNLAHIGVRKAIKIRKRLVSLGLLRETRVNTGRRGGTSIIVEVTERGMELLEQRERA